MANVEQHGNLWRVRFSVDGKRRRVGRFTTEEAAQKWADHLARVGAEKAMADLGLALDGTPARQRRGDTLVEYLSAWVEGLVHVTPGTKYSYMVTVRAIKGHKLGDIPLSKLTTSDVQQWVRDMEAANLAEKSVRNRVGLLSSCLKAAQRDGLVTTVATTGIHVQNRSHLKPMKEALTPEQFGFLAETVQRISPRDYPMLVFLAGTGLRWGEATALTTADVDLRRREVYVTKAHKFSGVYRKDIGPPKAAASRRTVPLPDKVVAVLKPLLKQRQAGEFIFQSALGNSVKEQRFRKTTWSPAMREFERRYGRTYRIHDLRAYYASTMANSGVPHSVLQKLVGHKNIQTTMEYYVGVDLEAATRAAALMNAAI